MLNKKKLKLLEIEQLPETERNRRAQRVFAEGENHERAIETSQVSGSQSLKYVFTAKVHRLGGKGTKTSQVLAVTFFKLKTSIPEFRIFFNKKNFIAEWLVSRPGHDNAGKWSSATLDWFSDWHIGRGRAACANGQSARLIRDYFKADSDIPPFDVMRGFQRDLRKAQLAARHKKETDPIDERMKCCRSLPKDFNLWINEVALDFSRYIYYRRKTKRLTDGYCTSCRQDMELRVTKKTPWSEARHGSKGKCPKCRKVITFMAIGKTTKLADEINAAYAQKTRDGFVLRYFRVTRKYQTHYREPTLKIDEYVRDFYVLMPDDEKKWDVQCYEHTFFKQTGRVRWCHSKNKMKTYPACLYTRNIRRVLADTYWKYSVIYELAKNLNKFNVWGYLEVYYNNPLLEYLVKARLYRIVSEEVNELMSGWSREPRINLKGKSIAEVLRLDTSGVRQLRRLNGGFACLYMIRAALRANIRLSDKFVTRFVGMGLDGGIIEELLKYVTPHKLLKYVEQNLRVKVWKGFSERRGKDVPHIISEFWRDYLTNCQLLGYDMKNDFIIFPRDLKAGHDEVMGLYKAEEDGLQDKAIRDMFEEMSNKFGFSYKGLIVRPPISANEVVAEGHALRHCVSVGSYISNIVKGKGFIFFIRQESAPDVPFFTAEVKDGVVRQCRGQSNCSMTEEIKKFVAQWQKKRLQAV